MEALVPITIDSTNLTSTSVPTLAADEVNWVTGTNYAVGIKAVSEGGLYLNTIAGTSSTKPALDPVRWEYLGFPNQTRMFDTEAGSVTTGVSPMTVTVAPGTVTSVGFFGMVNVDTIRIEVWDAPGGNLTMDETYSTEEFIGLDPYWAYFFDKPRQKSVLVIDDLPFSLETVVKFTASSFNGEDLGIGLAAYGIFQDLGLSQYGFRASPVDYSTITTDDYGSTKVKKGRNARDISGTAHLHPDYTNGVAEVIYGLMGVPAIYRATRDQKYDYLTTFGLGSAEITAAEFELAQLDFTVKGLI